MLKLLLPLTAALLAAGLAYAQVYTGPPNPTAAACAYSVAPASPISGQFYYIQCDSSGRIIAK